MRPLRSRSLAFWMAPLLWAGLLLQSGAWDCGCLSHNPWLLTIAHCLGDLDHHHHPAELVGESPSQELEHYHIPSRSVYLGNARVVNLPADVDVEFQSWQLVESPPVVNRGVSNSRLHSPPVSYLSSGPLRALLQVYLV
ncbi:MAG: hypothetical protein WDZ51_03135 [Pirellulaceae bacterium]